MTGDDRDGRCTGHAILFDIPAGPGEHGIARRSQGREIRGSCARYENRPSTGWQLQEIYEPPQCHDPDMRHARGSQPLEQLQCRSRIAGLCGNSIIEVAQVTGSRSGTSSRLLTEVVQVGPRTPGRIVENRIHMASLRQKDFPITIPNSRGGPDFSSEKLCCACWPRGRSVTRGRSMNTREPSLPFDVAGLDRYLTDVIAGFRGPIRVQQFAHGQSNPTYLLETSNERYVLRRKPPGVLLPSAHAVDREFRVMRALLPTDVPVPRTLCYCDDDSVIGTAFYVMEYIEGRIFQDVSLHSLQPAQRTAIYSELNRVIAALHRVEPANIGLGDFGKHGGYVARQVARWTKQYRAAELQQIDAMERLMEWLPQHIPAEQPSRITHGDNRLDNVILHPREPRILAVIDWELATLGDPLADFVYHCMPWRLPPGLGGSLLGSDLEVLGIPTESEYVRSYCERTDRARFEHFDFYMAFGMFRLAAILQGVAARAVQGNASG